MIPLNNLSSRTKYEKNDFLNLTSPLKSCVTDPTIKDLNLKLRSKNNLNNNNRVKVQSTRDLWIYFSLRNNKKKLEK